MFFQRYRRRANTEKAKSTINVDVLAGAALIAIPAKLSDFKIEPPSLLTLPVKNEMPVRVEMTWRLAVTGSERGHPTVTVLGLALPTSGSYTRWRLRFVSRVCFQFPVTHQTVMLITVIRRTQEAK